MINIAPPIPVDVPPLVPADHAVTLEWGLFIIDKGPFWRRRHSFELNEEAAGRSEATG